MILKQIFKSPWRKDNTAIPNTTNTTIPPELLTKQLAQTNSEMRRQACTQLADIELLHNTIAADPNPEVCATAASRLQYLLTGIDPASPPLADRLAYCERQLQTTESEPLANILSQKAQEPELRALALTKVTTPTVLVEIATNDPIATIRLAAVERLTDKSSLEQILRLVRKKDKSVYKIAKQRLKTITEQEQAPIRIQEQAQTICNKLERIVKRKLWGQDKSLVDIYTQEWKALPGAPPPDITSKFTAALDTFHQGYANYQAECQAQQELEAANAQLQNQRHQLLERLKTALISTDSNLAQTELTAIIQEWTKIHQDITLPKTILQNYLDLVANLEQHIQTLEIATNSCQKLTDHIQQARLWLTSKKITLEHQQLQKWQNIGQTLSSTCQDQQIQQNYQNTREQLQNLLTSQKEQAQTRLDQLPSKLQDLEQELNTGIMQHAATWHQTIRSDLALIRSSGIAHKQCDQIEARLHNLTPRLRELQSWRKWGTNQHRISMCETLEHMLTEDLAPTLMLEKVQALQQEWKLLNKEGNRINEALWQRFNTAADQIYAKCRPYLDEQNNMRELSRKARESLCQQVELFAKAVDWSQVNWKKVIHAVREVRATWEKLGAVDPRQQKSLNQRYHAAMRMLERPISQERAKNKALRQTLIEKAQTQAQNPDLIKAIKEIRQLQEQWHITVASKRNQEDSLWKAFRTACDQVFERRRGALQHQQEVIESQIKSLGAICETLETLAKTSGNQNLQEQFQDLKTKWENSLELGSLPRAEENRLQRRWQQGVIAVRRRIRLLEDAAKRAEMERLRSQAILCSDLEALVDQGVVPLEAQESTLATWQTRWNSLLKSKDPEWQTAMDRRLQAALTALTDPEANAQFQAKRQINTKERAMLCLQMEILAGVQSPPEATQERLAFQVSRLTGHLSQGVSDPLDEFPHLERSWYACGPALNHQIEDLEQRFDKSHRVLTATQSGTSSKKRVVTRRGPQNS